MFGGLGLIMLNRLMPRLEGRNFNRYGALSISILNFFLSLLLWYQFDSSHAAMQFLEKYRWMPDYDISYSLGIDGISLYLILLTTFLIPICILSSWNAITHKVAKFMFLFLLLESLVIGVFAATDLILFYLFFEAVLIPMFLIIGIWGAEERIYASFKFFIYTLFGSVLMLLAVLYIFVYSDTGDMEVLKNIVPLYSNEVQQWLWCAFFISFAIKVPMWPVHTWLPDAHVQAPTAGSVILAGVLLKLGGYGLIRFSLPLFPYASHYFADFVIVLSIIAVIYTSLVALAQDNIKKLIAYSSIAHMGYVTAGIFSLNIQGLQGAFFQMLSHGLVSAALFLCVGVLYDRKHTKDIAFYKGLTNAMPKFALWMMIFTLASVGLPGTSGFIGEFLVMFATFKTNIIFGALIALGMVLGAAYMLWLYARIMFGALGKNVKDITDISMRETIMLVPIAILIILLGIFPNIVMKDSLKAMEYLREKIGVNMEKNCTSFHNDSMMFKGITGAEHVDN